MTKDQVGEIIGVIVFVLLLVVLSHYGPGGASGGIDSHCNVVGTDVVGC